MNWHDWDLMAKEPAGYPSENEPENYILGRKHNEEISGQIGDLWELAPVVVKGMVLDLDSQGITDLGQFSGQDICLPSFPALHYSYGGIVSHRFKAWIENSARDWVSLRQVYPVKQRVRSGGWFSRFLNH